jgi:hypothetical protein
VITTLLSWLRRRQAIQTPRLGLPVTAKTTLTGLAERNARTHIDHSAPRR